MAAGPTELIRTNCPLATPANDGLMSAAFAALLIKRQIVTLTWNGAQLLDGDFPFQDVTWTAGTFSSAAEYAVFLSLQAVSPVGVWEKAGARTANGTRILAADQFTGTVEVKGELK